MPSCATALRSGLLAFQIARLLTGHMVRWYLLVEKLGHPFAYLLTTTNGLDLAH